MIQFKLSRKKIISIGVCCVLLFVSIFLRTYRLIDVPGRLTIDEMSIGYNVYSLIKTGKDEWGKSWPIIFRAFGDYKLPVYLYGTLPFVWVFGMNTLSIRAFSVLAGCIFVFLIGFLTQQLSRKLELGYIAAGIAALSPWPVFISRIGLESNVGLMLFCAALISLTAMFEKKSIKAAYVTGILFGLSWYTYIAFRFITGLSTVLLLLLSLRNKSLLPYITRLIISFGLLLAPLIPHIIDFSGQARFQQVSLFTDPGYVAEVNEDRSFCFLQQKPFLAQICPLLFNKPLSWLTAFTSNYVQLFSPSYLFTDGGELEYLNVPGFGAFIVVWLPFYVVGMWWWWRQNKILYRILGGIWLISAIPSALAGPAHPVRASASIPFVVLAIVFGVHEVWQKINTLSWRWWSGWILGGIIFILSARYFLNYFYVYPAQFDSAAYPLPVELGKYLAQVAPQYKKIYFGPIGGGLHMFTAYYLHYSPQDYQHDVVWPGPDKIGFTHPHVLGKFEFDTKTINDVFASSESGILYIDSKPNVHLATKTFYNFSGVHPQAMVYDVDAIKAYEKLHPELYPPVK